MIDVIAEQIIKGIIVANSKTGITCDDIGSKYELYKLIVRDKTKINIFRKIFGMRWRSLAIGKK